ncbi:HAMP domain-containing protein [Candidatus Entotheonella palauensis]|uniref:HAMP domain-containing protein n=1 Tax=Candidatus Entotheonella palauensis TaxID=93172 RepID=UPI000B7D366C|nr:HAMP domain-containing protein [Candidatus Entotheonella palauensis]
MNALLRYPIRHLVLVLLAGFAILIGLLTYLLTRPVVMQQVEQQASNRLRAELTQLQGVLQLLLRTNHLEGAQSVVASLGSAPEHELALVTDAAGITLASTRLADIGAEWTSLGLSLDTDLIKQAGATAGAVVQLDANHQRLLGYIPICGAAFEAALRPRQCGFLYQQLDLTPSKSDAGAALHRQAIGYSLGLAVVASLLGMVLHRVVTQRLERLIGAVKQFTAGDTNARASLQGRDELAQVSDAFDAMAQTIASNQQQREAARQFLQSTLNALSAHIAILDGDGTILAVNTAWQRFAQVNAFMGARYGIGSNYLHICDVATDDCAEEAPTVAEGIREVIEHRRDHFELEYPCHSPTEQRWFLARVTCFDSPRGIRVVIAHENITQRKLAEIDLQRAHDDLEQRVRARTAELETANEEVRRFAYLASHDLRTPLVNLQGFAGELRASCNIIQEGMAEALPHLEAAQRAELTREAYPIVKTKI